MVRGLKFSGLAGLLAAAALFAPAAEAAAPLSIPTLRQTSQDRRATLAAREQSVVTLREQQAVLAHRITALKRLEAANRLSNTAELERLLSQSVEAERTLAERQRDVETERRDLNAWVKRTTQQIDVEVKQRVPAIKKGSAKSRKKAARRIKALLSLRKEIESVAREKSDDGTAKWSRYVDVKIDPLDGPAELADKADFVEDTRDKYEKKRAAIREMLADARRESAIRRAASEFRSDLSLFDEESRSVRVTRGTANRAANEGADFSGGEPTSVRGPGVGQAPPPSNQESAPPTDAPTLTAGERDDTTGFMDPTSVAIPQQDGLKVGTGNPVPAATPPPVGGAVTPSIVRGLDAQALIKLRTDELGDKNLAPETLEQLLQELEALDRHLAAEAERLRKRARALEVDEANARGMK